MQLISDTINPQNYTDVTIGFDPDMYSVNEGDGSVTLFVSVLSGELDREVLIVFTTQDGTAIGNDNHC